MIHPTGDTLSRAAAVRDSVSGRATIGERDLSRRDYPSDPQYHVVEYNQLVRISEQFGNAAVYGVGR